MQPNAHRTWKETLRRWRDPSGDPDHSARHAMRRLWEGPVLTLLAIGALGLLRANGLDVPNPAAVLLLFVVYASFRGGTRSGLISTGLTLAYIAVVFSVPGRLLTYDPANAGLIIVVAVAALACAILVGTLEARSRGHVEREKIALEARARESTDALGRASEHAQESEVQYRTLLEQASDAIFVADSEGRFVDVNSRACELGGYSREELLTMRFEESLDPEELVTSPVHWAELRDGTPLLMERRLRRKDGTLVPVEISSRGFPDGRVQAIVRDITERRRNEAALRAAQDRLKTVVAGAPITLFETDLGGILTFIEGRTLADQGLRSEDLVGKSVFDVYPDRTELREGWASARAGTLSTRTTEIRDRSYEVWFLPKRDGRGTAVGVLGLSTDITDRVAAERERARLFELTQHRAEDLEHRVQERTAELRERNEELEAFAYSVSHDLRAPLRAMEGFSQSLLEDYAESLAPEGREFARRIAAAARRMDEMIQDLLAYSRVGRSALHIRNLDTNVVVKEVLGSLEKDFLERGATVTVEGVLSPIYADHATVTHILSNLLSNAVKFVGPGTKPEVRIRAEPRDGYVRLWVEDNGIGIPEEYRERIWRPFERLHSTESYPGTGIGLAIVRKAAEHLGGRVGVESTVGQGSRFWADLPAARGESA